MVCILCTHRQSLSRTALALTVFELVLQGTLEVEGLHQLGLVQHLGVAHASDVHPLRLHPHAQFCRAFES